MSGRLSQRDTWQWSAPGHHWSQHTVSCLLSTLATFQQRTLRCSVWCLGVLWHRNKLQKHFYIFCAKLIVFCWQWESQFMFPETPRIFGESIWTSQSLPWHTLFNIRISGLLIFYTFTRLRVTRDTLLSSDLTFTTQKYLSSMWENCFACDHKLGFLSRLSFVNIILLSTSKNCFWLAASNSGTAFIHPTPNITQQSFDIWRF